MIGEFLPEVHDVGKMVDNNAVIDDYLAHPDPRLAIIPSALDAAKRGERVPGHTLTWINWDSETSKPFENNLNLKLARVHHTEEYERLPEQGKPLPENVEFRKRVILLRAADHYASTFSRAVAQQNELAFEELGKALGQSDASRKRLVLWNKSKSPSIAIKSVAEFVQLIEIFKIPELSSPKFLQENESVLEFLPEDQSAPRDVTSLLTHMRLVGSLYRFLTEHYADSATLLDTKIPWLDKEHKIRTVREATTQAWQMTLATCRLRVPQQPARVGDLTVFQRQEQVLGEIKKNYGDQVLFYTNDTIWLMLPSSKQINLKQELEQAMAPIFGSNFWAEVRSLENVNLRAKQLHVQRLRWKNDAEIQEDKQVRETSVYALPAEIFDPPLCSICQIRQATKEWPKDSEDKWVRQRSETPEPMCEVCLKIRDVPVRDRFKQLARWHPEDVEKKEGQSDEEFEAEAQKIRNIKTAWVKLTLDYDKLSEFLGKSYSAHLDLLRARVPADNAPALQALEIAHEDFNPLALMADFTEDFRRMTQSILVRLSNDKWEFESIRKMDFRDFFVIKMESGADVLRFLQLYGEALLEYFPDALDDCPVRVAMNMSLIKYPFYEHWRWISAPQEAVNLQMPETARVEIGAKEFFEFLTKLNMRDPKGELRLTKTYLERMRAVEARTKSRALLQSILLADIEARRIPQTLQPFIELYKQDKITLQDILDWHKVTTWGV